MPTTTIRINGESERSPPRRCRLLTQQRRRTGERGIAVALNGPVVPRAAWADDARCSAGDNIEIVRARQGG